MVFTILITLNIFFSVLRLMDPLFLSSLSIILLSFMGLNHLAYMESLHGVQPAYAPWYVAIIVVMSSSFVISSRGLLGFWSERNSIKEICMRKNVIEFIAIRALYILFMAMLTTGTVFEIYTNKMPNPLHLSLMNHYVFWFVVGQLWLCLANRNELDIAFSKLVVTKSALRIRHPNQVFVVFALATLGVGSVFEIMRGLWFIWFGTWLAVVLLFMNYWRMLKYTLVEEGHREYEIRDNNTFDIKGIQDNWAYYLLRYVFIGSLLGTIYAITLLVLLVKRIY